MEAGSFPEDEKTSKGRKRLVLAALVVLALVGATVAYVVTRDSKGHPGAWDERVADIADFVEDERDLSFDHPVHVDFLTEDAFNELVTTDQGDLTDEERAEIEDTAAILRALGLIAGDVELVDAMNRLSESRIAAFYDPQEERVRVKGTELSPVLRATLAHELTHALQDQHFDLKRLAQVEEETESSAFRALIEGDATRVENAFSETLDEDELAEIDEDGQEALDELEVADLPAVLSAILFAPYALGEPLATTLVEAGGDDALNEAIAEPPTSDESLFDPLGYLDGDEPVEVDEPPLDDGEEEVDRGIFGSIGWYVMLAQRIDPVVALDAVDGWGGDAYVAYERDDTVCVRIAWVGDRSEDVDELAGALEDWTAEMPEGAASIDRQGDNGLTLQSCDPGDDASVPDDIDADDLLLLPATRSTILAGVLAGGAERELARCFAAEIVQAFSVEQLLAEEVDPEMQAQIADLAEGCR